jgi:hypothetical protein
MGLQHLLLDHIMIITNILYHPVMLFPLIRAIFNNYVQHNIPVHTAVPNCVLVYGMVLYLRVYSVTAMMISEWGILENLERTIYGLIKVLSWHLSGGTIENCLNPQTGWLVLQPIFGTGTFWIQASYVSAKQTCMVYCPLMC